MTNKSRTFEQFYKERIQPVLNDLDTKRKKLRLRAVRTASIVFAVVTGIGTAVSLLFGVLGFIQSAIIGVLAGCAVAIGVAHSDAQFLRTYKKKVVAPVFEFVGDDLRYTIEDAVSENDVMASGLFEEPKSFRSEDKVIGTFENASITICDVVMEWEDGKHDDKVRGIYCTADMYRTASQPVRIQPTDGSAVHTALEGDEVDLESVDFERQFDVRGDQLVARQILTPRVMQQLMHLRKEFETTPFLAYDGARVSLFIPTGKDLFEPHIFAGFKKKHVKQYVEDVRAFLTIIHTLNLDQK